MCWPTFRLMGRDDETVVMTGGMCGFMLGTTASALANVEAAVDSSGPAPRGFLRSPAWARSSSTSPTPR